MIPRIQSPEHRPSWQEELSNAVKSVDELLELLQIDPAQARIQPLQSNFPLRVPRGFVQRMAKGDSRDPLLLQVLPVAREMERVTGFRRDPLDELEAMPSPGLLHKYRGRALLTMTGACAIHCRYCFRRHFPYSDANPASGHWQPALDYLARHPDITELILSGGDPLTLTDARLHSLTEQLSSLPRLRALRIHTRMPVVLPERVDEGLIAWIKAQTLKMVVIVHCNHPNEIDHSVTAALDKLAAAGVTLLNQSVLLRDINDSSATLALLSERLFASGVLPYYLHQMDKVQGAAHFEVAIEQARDIVAGLHATLPGYLVPRLVQEIPGMPGKTPL
jgi:EF-P beta-lysylation protein EpmB